jgi:DNA-binding HxlR family transcriptional regulator
MSKRKNPLKEMSFQRSDCPLACALDVIGDKWSLVIVRDLFFGKRRFSEFQSSDEGITTNILTERLTRLERAGLVEKRLYQKRPPRYEYHLSESGRALSPILKAYVTWARTHIPGTRRFS